tara:strand:- start:9292 stop:9756 length:465 start_codon:yes stop_codon:yes gene_type:complete
MSFDSGLFDLPLKGEGLRIGIVAAAYNRDRVDTLTRLVVSSLEEMGVLETDIRFERVPGSMEIPYAASQLAKNTDCHAVIGLGIVIAGDTSHHDVIGYSTAISLQNIATSTGIPIVNGILVVNTEQQADDRIGGKVDRGAEFARAAVALANLKI